MLSGYTNIIFHFLLVFKVFYFVFSGPDDDVFVYFADHGAPGLIAFPDGAVVSLI